MVCMGGVESNVAYTGALKTWWVYARVEKLKYTIFIRFSYSFASFLVSFLSTSFFPHPCLSLPIFIIACSTS